MVADEVAGKPILLADRNRMRLLDGASIELEKNSTELEIVFDRHVGAIE
ncbi:MAG: hypothetical protein AAF360_07830 [Pseudomonadota bacterium]